MSKNLGLSDTSNINNLEKFGLVLIKNDMNLKEFFDKTHIMSKRIFDNIIVIRLMSDFDMYLVLKFFNRVLIFKDKEYIPYNYKKNIIIFLIISMIISFFYYFTIKKLDPLKNIIKDVNSFADGNLDIDTSLKGNDEISQVGNSLANAVKQIKKLLSSRTLFLRNIIHELKTPITRGIISAEMIANDNKQKVRLIDVFQRLESLINEFVVMEKISSGYHNKLDIKEYKFIDIVNYSSKLAMLSKNNIIMNFDNNLKLNVDYSLFCIAVKNLIDNAIKYSYDSKVEIKSSKNNIYFISKGEKLSRPLNAYLEPFLTGNEKKNKNSFGLGLYIVLNIFKLHNFNLLYRYDDKNIFYFNI